MAEVVDGLDLETGEFKFPGLNEGGYIEVWLSPTEREMIRPLAAEGQPLWKIQKGLLDYRTVLTENLAMLDLTDSGQLERAKALSAEIKAINWQHSMWTRMLGAPEIAEKDFQK